MGSYSCMYVTVCMYSYWHAVYVTPIHYVCTHCSLTSEEVPSEEVASTHKLDDTKKKRHEVWRRYSEFEILRNFLCSVFPYVSTISYNAKSCIHHNTIIHYTAPYKYLWLCVVRLLLILHSVFVIYMHISSPPLLLFISLHLLS